MHGENFNASRQLPTLRRAVKPQQSEHICMTVAVVSPKRADNLRLLSQEKRTVFFPSIDMQVTSPDSTVKVKVRASMVDNDNCKNSNASLTLSCSTNSRSIQVQVPGNLLNQVGSQLQRLLETYNEFCEAGRVVPRPRGAVRSASMMRCPPWRKLFPKNSKRRGTICMMDQRFP